MEIRRPDAADLDPLLAFFAAVPDHERTFFKEAVLDRGTVEGWLRDERGRRAIACERGAVIGYAAVVPLAGWSDHVAELRLVVDPAYRRTGVGRELARWALIEAVQAGLRKLTVEVVAEQEGAVAMFQALGFCGEGLLCDHVRDRGGELRDLMLLAHPVGDTWATLTSAGLEDELG